jgi:DNA polymerase bacteriophage-type
MTTKPKVIGVRLDIETKSATDIKAGSYRYSEDPEFGVVLLAYSPIRQYPGGATKLGHPRLLDLSDAHAVADFGHRLVDGGFQKHAFNANFERVCLSRWLGLPTGRYINPHGWYCSAVKANVNGVFGTLDEVARAVRSPITKLPEGRRLIKLFSIPDRKAGKFHQTHGVCWCGADHAADFALYGDYCKQDVVTEAMVAASFPDMPTDLQAEYEADQRINDRGVRHFRGLSQQAVAQVEVERDRLMGELKQITGLDNPNSTQQMQRWLAEQGYPMESLDKAHRAEAMTDPFTPEIVAEVLTLKGAASLSSVAKHKAALDTRSGDGRIRGSLRFYGAHTGREAGRGIQPQNLPRYEAPNEDRTRLIRGLAGQDAPTIAKGTVRSSLVPARGNVFVTCDYNAIEARCLGWEAGEQWVEAEFRGEGKIYEATAAMMFGVEKAQLVAALKGCGKCNNCQACETRSKGKVSNLALGYAGGAGALVTMGAADAGIDCGNYMDLNAEWVRAGKPGKFHEWERELHDYPELLRIRDLFRDASPATVRFWKHCGIAWDAAAIEGKTVQFGPNGSIAMLRDGRHNRLVLPSGRSIWYRFARSHQSETRPDRVDRRTFIGKAAGVGHARTDTHGGKLTENVTQAVARDVLFDLMMKIEAKTAAGWPGKIVLHVHDEVVLEVPKVQAEQVLADTIGLMGEAPAWGTGLAVKGEGAIMERYGK